MIKKLTVKPLVQIVFIFLFIPLLFTSLSKAQSNGIDDGGKKSTKFDNQIFLAISNANSSLGELDFNNRSGMSLAIDYNKFKLNQKLFVTQNSFDDDYVPHEATKHFWLAVGELAIVEFIPWAAAKWVRDWEHPEDNWANVTADSWWNNISKGWEYDGDAFLTNYFAHPYHGSLYFNTGRSNGYSFWESTAWAAVGSGLWEYFGETFRPAFNDWINTTVNGITLGEVLHRLSVVVTDNTATGSRRVWLEIGGALINPMRGFNRLISGETARVYPNPQDRKPDDFIFKFQAGARRIDKKGKGDQIATRGETEGIFSVDFLYGNIIKDDLMKPFSSFQLDASISTQTPHLTRLSGRGNLFGWELKKNRKTQHRFVSTLNYNYLDNPGFTYGGTSTVQQIISRFAIGEKTNIVTNAGAEFILMGATPTDFFEHVEGRNYDFGPGVGINLSAVIRSGAWNVVRLLYTSKWIWTQSEPADSKHHLHLVLLDGGYPITNYIFVGLGAGVYWRNSAYNYPSEVADLIDGYQADVQTANPFVMLF
ncbi:MAG: DUF3943 domain-containing protein, partial [Ignavibacteriaceae bacterium]